MAVKHKVWKIDANTELKYSSLENRISETGAEYDFLN